MGLLDNLNFSQPFRISSLLPSEAQLQAFKQKSDAEALEQFSQDPNPIRRVPFNILTALGVNPTIAQAAPTTLDVAPVTGDISALADARTAFGQGDLATAGLLTAATLLPVVPAGKVKGLLKKSDDTKPLLNVDDAPKEGIANVVPPTDTDSGIIAFHGSGADFDQFRMDKIGTGEGNQAFGYGLYFTDSEDIAKFYKNAGLKSQNVEYKGTPIKFFSDDRDEFDREAIIQGLVRDRILGGKFNTKESIDSVINQLEQTIENSYDLSQPLDRISQEGYEGLVQDLNYAKTLKADDFSYNAGKTYKVALAPKPDELLDYDLPFSQQNKFVKERLSKVANEMTVDDAINLGFDPFDFGNNNQAAINAAKKEMLKDDQSVQAFLNNWQAFRGEQGAGEKLLNKHGIKGIKYLDNASRNTFGGKLLGINKLDDGQFQARIVLDDPNRQTGLGGSGRVITTSKPYKTQKEAEDWANKEMGNRQSNYVIFDENLINILAKYGIVGGVGITALQNSDI
jgi:hypothetical protein